MRTAYQTNWVSTIGENINETERLDCETTGSRYAVALSSGTAALHMAVKRVGEFLYGMPSAGEGIVAGKRESLLSTRNSC